PPFRGAVLPRPSPRGCTPPPTGHPGFPPPFPPTAGPRGVGGALRCAPGGCPPAPSPRCCRAYFLGYQLRELGEIVAEHLRQPGRLRIVLRRRRPGIPRTEHLRRHPLDLRGNVKPKDGLRLG